MVKHRVADDSEQPSGSTTKSRSLSHGTWVRLSPICTAALQLRQSENWFQSSCKDILVYCLDSSIRLGENTGVLVSVLLENCGRGYMVVYCQVDSASENWVRRSIVILIALVVENWCQCYMIIYCLKG